MSSDIPPQKLPSHLAIIMDGNGRWAKERGLTRLDGHRAGAESVRVIVRAARKLGIPYLTLYAFSKENWRRPKMEVRGLWALLRSYLKSELKEMLDTGIALNTVGATQDLPKETRELINETMKATAKGHNMVLTLALSYGGRDEIVHAARSLAEKVATGSIRPDDIDKRLFAAHLYTKDIPDPDLLIRTSGESRISNFLLWQVAYTEIYITETYWPDFREEELHRALEEFAGRERRFGLTNEQISRGKGGPPWL